MISASKLSNKDLIQSLGIVPELTEEPIKEVAQTEQELD